jgi:WD40 repeat protein
MQIKRRHTCTGHRAAIYALAPGRDHRHFLTAGGDGWVVEWNLDDPETGKVIATTDSQIFSLARLPGDKLVAGNMNGGLHWIDLEHPERTRGVQAHRKGIYDFLVLPHQLMSVGGDGMLTVWNMAREQPEASIQLSAKSLRCIAYAPGRDELAIGASDNSITFVDASTLLVKAVLPDAHQNSVFSLVYSPDETTLLSGSRDAFLRVWEVPAERDGIPYPSQRSPELAAHLFTINHICYAPDGSLVATASRDKTIKIWDAHTFELLKVLDTIRDGGHLNSVNKLMWLPGVLVSVSDDRSAVVWG